ncbi:aminotransferase class V-fold PLP-dependent enzyme [Paramicrobacterium agarici]|uniref:Selenocysteine lyase/cysteine desulfurase n=1 Tax=Paramicrobacterium agarici TaxID=630514 RepID=A0A2A9DZE9_9MICO|nr:aminotransferase class V-fold PLP-dependent enzyme [Microbacterium agarici]PFG31756.1 selenocysteine lyase/cysteine desulfurase [Microbacterium agarici]
MTLEQFRETFLEEPGYLNYASIGPVSATVRAELRAEYDALSRMRFGAGDRTQTHDDRLADAVSAMTGHPAANIIAQPNTSTALLRVMFALDGHVVMSRNEFPSLPVAAVRAQTALDRLSITWIDGDDVRVAPEILTRALNDEVTAVAVSLVDARTGHRADLGAIREVIGDRILIVDAIQGAGVVDAAYEAADVVATGGQKWLRAGWGTGFLSFSDRALERLDPVISGYTGTPEYEPWGHVPQPASGEALAFTTSGPDYVAEARLAAAIEEVNDVGIDQIEDAVLDRVGEVIEMLDSVDLPVVSPRSGAEQSGIVVVRPDEGRLAALGAALHNTGLTTTSRQGAVRFSIHAGTGDPTLRMLKQALLVYRSSYDT